MAYVKKHYQKWYWKHIEENRKKNREKQARWRKRNPEKAKKYERKRDPLKTAARLILRDAVKSGKIKKPSMCEKCQNKSKHCNIQGHHSDYTKPLEVMWLCAQCHTNIHRLQARNL